MKHVFTWNVQRLPAGRKYVDVGGILNNVAGDVSDFLDETLAAIENDKRPARAQKIEQRLDRKSVV